MDVLEPDLIWVDNRCYRFYESKLYSSERKMDSYQEDESEANYNTDDEDLDENIPISQLPNGKYSHRFDCPKELYPFIIGTKGATKKRIETETNTVINIPRFGKNGDIIITSSTRKNIISGKNRINLIIESSRKKLRFTHFLSIPCNTNSIIERFNEFKSDIITNIGKNKRNICEEVFQIPEKLHFTICAMTLLDNKERNEARDLLFKCKKDVIDPLINENGPIKIQIKGIDIMNDDPTEATILFATIVDESGLFEKLFNAVNDYFYSTDNLKTIEWMLYELIKV